MKSSHLGLTWRMNRLIGFTYSSMGDSKAGGLKKKPWRKDDELRKLVAHYQTFRQFYRIVFTQQPFAAFLRRSLVKFGTS